MRRNRIRAESIEQKQVERTIGFTSESQPAIADNNVAIRTTAGYESEIFTCDAFDGGIDLIKPNVVRRVAERGHSSCAEPHYGKQLGFFSPTQRFNHVAHRSTGVVVRQRLAGFRGFRAFNAVNRVAVDQLAQMRSWVFKDLLNAEEIAGRVNPTCTLDVAGKYQ